VSPQLVGRLILERLPIVGVDAVAQRHRGVVVRVGVADPLLAEERRRALGVEGDRDDGGNRPDDGSVAAPAVEAPHGTHEARGIHPERC